MARSQKMSFLKLKALEKFGAGRQQDKIPMSKITEKEGNQ
jgi:hypothetical protein